MSPERLKRRCFLFKQKTTTATQKNHYFNDILLNFVGSEHISKGRETHEGKQLYFYVSGFALNLCVFNLTATHLILHNEKH